MRDLSPRFGFIQYDCAEVARRASDEMCGFLLEGSRIDVNVASERRKKRNPGEILESVKKIPRYLRRWRGIFNLICILMMFIS